VGFLDDFAALLAGVAARLGAAQGMSVRAMSGV